jgi:hypothetical protein
MARASWSESTPLRARRLERRSLDLKGKAQAVEVVVLTA